MVILHEILTTFIVFCFLSFMIVSINSIPQNYNENVNWWRSYPRRYYTKNGYYSNQRYHPANYHPSDYRPPEYHHPEYHSPQYHSPEEYRHLNEPSQNYESYGYHRPRTQPEPIPLVRARSRGPSKEVLPTPTKEVLSTPNTKHNQFNSSEDKVNQTNGERGDRGFEASKASSSESIEQQNDFVFPEHPILQPSTPPPRVISYVPDVSKVLSKCGSDAIFCDFRGDYPSEVIRRAFDSATEKYGDLLGRDEIQKNVSITTRFDVPSDGTPMCASKEKIIEPPAAKNKDNEWKWIVNEGPFVQGVRVEMCDNPDSQCAMADNFPIGYKTECKQKFIYRKLLVLDSSGQVEPDTFRLPSCCACIYRQDNTASRFMKPAFGTSPRRK